MVGPVKDNAITTANLLKCPKAFPIPNGVNYLRFSLTDRCNLNCLYCTPLEKKQFLRRQEVLCYEEIARIAALFVKCGITKLRLTGGEPLIKKDILWLVKMLKSIEDLEEIAMTTNGVHLEEFAPGLKGAGLDRVNISIDTLKKDRFKHISGFDCFDKVWRGIMEALGAGFSPVKLNVILMNGINNDEILDFLRLVFDYPLVVRFIEYFSTNKRSAKLGNLLLRSIDAKEEIERHFKLTPSYNEVIGSGPAQYYKPEGAKGFIGFISSYSANFCGNCNRIRIDCAGRVSPCLFSGFTHDLRLYLRAGYSEEAILTYIKGIFQIKSEHRKDKSHNRHLEMSSIGG